ncbi:MAG: glycosyltransferase, partial [Ignavibacteria bacterium]|nr:glycosyltransferase [Ignavibacteria bacterium]
ITFVVAKSIYDRIHSYTDKVELITNGINTDFYSNPNIVKNDVLKKIEGKKIIGYLGTVRNWMDFDLLEAILRKFPNAVLMFVGYVDRNGVDDFERLKKYKNLLHIDFIPQEETPSYLAAFDVGLIPFKVNDFTVSVFPYKFYEYIAASIPIVTTALPELYQFKEYILYSETNEMFLENTKSILEGKFKLDKVNYSKIAYDNSWDKKVGILEKRIMAFLPRQSV